LAGHDLSRSVLIRQLLEHAGLKAEKADSGAVTLIHRFGSVADLS